MLLGIEERTHLVFEGPSPFGGRGLWPLPMVTPAAIVAHASDNPAELLPQDSSGAPLLHAAQFFFREDFFDPVTRIRRGRFYKPGAQPRALTWSVSPHPALNLGAMGRAPVQASHEWNAATGLFQKELITFQSFSLWHEFPDFKPGHALVALGTKQSPTIWKVLSAEPISTGEELVTLKARSAFGTLPELSSDKITDPSDRAQVVEMMEKLADTVYRAGPEPVIHLARDAASAILLAAARQYGDKKISALDLANTASLFEKYPELSNLILCSRQLASSLVSIPEQNSPNRNGGETCPPFENKMRNWQCYASARSCVILDGGVGCEEPERLEEAILDRMYRLILSDEPVVL